MVALAKQPNMWNEPITVQRGDVWQLGRHRLMCGDSTNAEDVARLMQGEIAQLGLHDPPYGVSKKMSWGFGDGWEGNVETHGRHAWKRPVFNPITGDNEAFNPQHLLTSGSIVVIWGANHFADRLPASSAWIIWDKRVTMASNHQSDCEMAWVSTGNTSRMIRHKWNGYVRDSEVGHKHLHPTQKPIMIMAQVIEKYTAENDLVTDWYAGSGTTLIASENTKRRCYAMEIEPHYCQVIIERWQNVTGQHAQRVEVATW